MSSTSAIIEYYDAGGKRCSRTEDFVAPIGGERLGIFADDDAHTAPHTIINMATPAFMSVKWDNDTTDRIYRRDLNIKSDKTIGCQMPVNQKLKHTIHETICNRIESIRANAFEPVGIVLNKNAYLALAAALHDCHHHVRLGKTRASAHGTVILDIEEYMGIMVLLDMDAKEDVKVLRKPFEELAYPTHPRKQKRECM